MDSWNHGSRVLGHETSAGGLSTLVTHAGGNPRTLTVMADALLATAAELEREVLDEKLFFDTWGETPKRRGARR